MSKNKFSSLLNLYQPSKLGLGKHGDALVKALGDANHLGDGHVDIHALRAAESESLDKNEIIPYPEGLSSTSYQQKVIGNMPCFILEKEAQENRPTIVMFFGGGFCLRPMSGHQSFMAHVARLSSCRVIIPDYPLAPEHKAPEVLARCHEFLKTLIEQENEQQFIIMGWSSGGNLALNSTLALQASSPAKAEQIQKLMLLSAWMDLSMEVTHECPYQEAQALDSISAGADVLAELSKHYLPEDAIGNEPTYCPANVDKALLNKLPPVDVIVGGSEVILGDSIYLTEKLKDAGVKTQLVVLENQIHLYMVFGSIAKDGVFVPALINERINNRPVDTMRGDDGLGLIVKNYN